MHGKNASVCYCCRFLVFSVAIMNRANSNAAFGRSKEAPHTVLNEGPVSQNA